MKIDAYKYGSMIIGGKEYTKDLIIFPDRIKAEWWREEGHLLNIEDLSEVIKEKPDLLIIGTGESGCMQVPLSAKSALKEKGIDVVENITAKAVQFYNGQIRMGKIVVGAFHLTC